MSRMPHWTLVAALVATSSSSCTHRRILGPRPTPAEVRAFNRRAGDARATVRLRSDGSEVTGGVTLEGSALTFPPPLGTEPLPLEDVEWIRYRSGSRGGRDGLLWGLVAGVGVGIFGVGFAAGPVCEDDCDTLQRALAMGGVFGLAGGTLGMAIGSVIGAPCEYTVTGDLRPGGARWFDRGHGPARNGAPRVHRRDPGAPAAVRRSVEAHGGSGTETTSSPRWRRSRRDTSRRDRDRLISARPERGTPSGRRHNATSMGLPSKTTLRTSLSPATLTWMARGMGGIMRDPSRRLRVRRRSASCHSISTRMKAPSR